jgi:hypothetical protein
MSHRDDARKCSTKLIAQLGDQRLAGGPRVAEVIIKLESDAERGAKVLDDARKGHEGTYGTPTEKQSRWGAWQLHSRTEQDLPF